MKTRCWKKKSNDKKYYKLIGIGKGLLYVGWETGIWEWRSECFTRIRNLIIYFYVIVPLLNSLYNMPIKDIIWYGIGGCTVLI